MKRTANQQKRKTQPKTAEEEFLNAWERIGFSGSDLERQYKFHPKRQWKFDFASPRFLLGIEIDGRGRGGKFGGHHTVAGVRNDCEKANTAIAMGWTVLRYPATDMQRRNEWGESLLELFIELIMDLMVRRYEAERSIIRPQVESLQSLPTTPLGASPRSVSRTDTSKGTLHRRGTGTDGRQSWRTVYRKSWRSPQQDAE